ncbi:MAG: hypothetical protein IKS98_12835 [Lachnospiraceae bacterium]|nr:hypothetical protein [Lachnospiraceae bacterium]
MKAKKVFLGCLLCLLMLFVMGEFQAEAASKKVKLEPRVTYETHNGYFMQIKIPFAADKIASVEYLSGKVKKSADKYWNDSKKDAWIDYNTKNTKITYYCFYITENGYYSARVTTKSGKKYVACVKVKNIAPKSDNSRLMAYITKVSKPDSEGNYTVTADYYKQLTAVKSNFAGKGKGDIVEINGRKVELLEFYKKVSYTESVPLDSFTDDTEMVVVKPVDPKEFADIKDDYNDNVFVNYDNLDFGYVIAGNNWFYAFLDYDYWMDGSDYYVGLNEKFKTNSKLKVTKDTTVGLCLTSDVISGTDYLSYREGYADTPEGMYVSKNTPMHIYEKYDKKKKKFTNTVSEIDEIYRP